MPTFESAPPVVKFNEGAPLSGHYLGVGVGVNCTEAFNILSMFIETVIARFFPIFIDYRRRGLDVILGAVSVMRASG